MKNSAMLERKSSSHLCGVKTSPQKIKQKCDIQLTPTVLCMVNALPQHQYRTQKPFIPDMVSHGFDIHTVLYGVLSITFHLIKYLELCSLA